MKLKLILILALLGVVMTVSADSLTDRLSSAFSGNENEILDPEQAFRIDSNVRGPNQLEISWEIEPGYYLYRDKFAFVSQDTSVELQQAEIPPGDLIDDPLFGQVEINTGHTSVNIPLRRTNLASMELNVEVQYQGCKKDAVCYPPVKKTLNFILPTAAAATDLQQEVKSATLISEQDAVTRKLTEGSLLVNVALFFGFGLLLSLTPCVFPMIPILSGVIVGQGSQLSTRKAFILSLVYVLAMAVTYALLGIVAGSFHFNLQAAAQSPWIIISFSLVFVALALSMFGFYEIQLPSSISQKLDNLSRNQSQGDIIGVAIMGVLSAVIVGPCVAPPLAGALLYISQTGDALLGGLALFAMGLGFGVPLLIIGTSAGRLLPKAGAWMETIKAIFGVVMLGVAIWFLERILPGNVTLLLWACLIMVSAIFMGALKRTDSEQSSWSKLWQGLGLVMMLYAAMLVFGAMVGGKDVLNPIPNNFAAGTRATASQTTLAFKSVKSAEDLQRELQQASLQDKMVMLDFYAKWCVDCNEMEAYTFPDAGVQSVLSDLVLLKADVTDNDEIDQALLRKFNLFGPPAILFFNTSAEEQLAYRLVGFIDASDFISHVSKVKSL